jgi:hypothetical protein
MTDRARVLPIVGLLAGVILVTVGCASPVDPTSPPSTVSAPGTPPAPTAGPATSTEFPHAASAGAVDLARVPIACYGLGADDCRRVAGRAAAALTNATRSARIVYVRVGPFGCPDGERCPTTLAARPEGDVTIEFAGVPAAGFHVRSAAGGPLEVVPQEVIGIVLDPTTTEAFLAGVQPFTLGHCGLWSGIDLGGSWWDPVGPIDFDHGDTINAAEGTIAFTDPDHATFTSNGGLTVQLQRRDGPKHLPFCE